MNARRLTSKERGYDVGAVAGAPIPILSNKRGDKGEFPACLFLVILLLSLYFSAESKQHGYLD